MNERLTKSDVFDIVFVVFGLFCLYRAVTVLTLHFFMGLMQSTESVSILLNALFAMASAFIWHLSIRMEPVSRGYLWKQLAPYTVLVVAAAILILKSKAIGNYLDTLRGACNDRQQPASGS